MACPSPTTMTTLLINSDEALDIETLGDAQFHLERILCAIDDGARGLESLADELRDIVAEYEEATEQA